MHGRGHDPCFCSDLGFASHPVRANIRCGRHRFDQLGGGQRDVNRERGVIESGLLHSRCERTWLALIMDGNVALSSDTLVSVLNSISLRGAMGE